MDAAAIVMVGPSSGHPILCTQRILAVHLAQIARDDTSTNAALHPCALAAPLSGLRRLPAVRVRQLLAIGAEPHNMAGPHAVCPPAESTAGSILATSDVDCRVQH